MAEAKMKKKVLALTIDTDMTNEQLESRKVELLIQLPVPGGGDLTLTGVPVRNVRVLDSDGASGTRKKVIALTIDTTMTNLELESGATEIQLGVTILGGETPRDASAGKNLQGRNVRVLDSDEVAS